LLLSPASSRSPAAVLASLAAPTRKRSAASFDSSRRPRQRVSQRASGADFRRALVFSLLAPLPAPRATS